MRGLYVDTYGREKLKNLNELHTIRMPLSHVRRVVLATYLKSKSAGGVEEVNRGEIHVESAKWDNQSTGRDLQPGRMAPGFSLNPITMLHFQE
jgi:hypothetical protein